MLLKATALIALTVGFAAPAFADATDDAFIANLNTSGMNFGAPDKAIQLAKTVVCGTLSGNPNTSNADLVSKVTHATSWPALDAAYFTGAAIEAYCPQFGGPLTAPSIPGRTPAPPSNTTSKPAPTQSV